MSGTAIVAKVSGAAFVIRGGQEMALSQGMELLISDSIRTGMNGQCELRFADETEVELSPMSQVQIQDFAYNSEVPAENSFALHMMEGLVRTVSGEVVKLNPEGFALSTPLGTAGIRGTTVIAQIFPTHVVFMVTEMGAGNTVVVNSIFGGDLTILMPGQGAEISLTEQQRITLIDSMPESMRDAARDFFENKYDDARSSHDNSILLFGDVEFLAALGAENVGRGVGMLSAENEEILIELLQELGVEQPEFFLEAVFGSGSDELGEYAILWGDSGPNRLVPSDMVFGDDFKNLNYDIRGFEASDEIVSFNGADIVYGGQGNGSDVIQKISPAITAGNLIVGGEQALDSVSLDSDQIILRSLGANTDNENGWLAISDTDYGATVMSGGSVVGSAVDLSNSSGSGNLIKLYGSMTGGIIYGSAVNSTGNTLAGNTIIISEGLDTDNITRTGGLLDGGTIYGDAKSITGGTAGSDYISVTDMNSGTIYGDAASGSGYTPGNNEIFVTNTMSGGTIHAGNGNDTVDVGTMSGGTINAGAGDDEVLVDTISSGTIRAGSGSNVVSIDTAEGGTLLLSAASSAVITHINDTFTVANASVTQNVEVTNLNNGGTLTTGNGADIIDVTTLKTGGTLNSGAGNDTIDVTTMESGSTLNSGAGTDQISIGAMKGGTLLTGAGDDSVTISVYEGGKIDMGAGRNLLTVTTQDADLEIADIASGSGLNINAGTGGASDTIRIDKVHATNVANPLSLDSNSSDKTLVINTLTGGTSGYIGAVALGGDNAVEIGAISLSVRVLGDRGVLTDATGGKSTISLLNDTLDSGMLSGDALTMTNSSGGADLITVKAISSGGHIYGDASEMFAGSIGGDDEIEVTGTVDGWAYIYGDAHTMTNSSGGKDEITINVMDSGSVYGDGATMTDSSGGADSINITTMNGGRVYGDASEMIVGSNSGGDDSIYIGTMNGGYIYGDGSTMTDSSGGADSIHIGTFKGGYIYGEGHYLTNHTADNNTIRIDSLAGSDAKYIFAGRGADRVIISGVDTEGATNLHVGLSNNIQSDGKQDYLDLSGITLQGDATITVNGLDLGDLDPLIYDKIIYSAADWDLGSMPGANDKKNIHVFSNGLYSLTLEVSGGETVLWSQISDTSIP